MADSQTPNTPDDSHSSIERRGLVESLLYHIGQYLSAIYEGWVSLVGGIAGIILLALIIFWGEDYAFLRDNKKTFVWMAFICLVIAGFAAWRKERQKWERLGGLAAISITPKEIVSVFNGRTSAQGERLAKNYIGKWIRVSGSIYDVSNLIVGKSILVHLHSDPTIMMEFSRKWVDSLSVLRKGDNISALGRIDRVTEDYVSLERCELLEVGAGETEKKDDKS